MNARALLVVIDPQKAFTHPEGSLACAYGYDEIVPCVDALENLRGVLVAELPRGVKTVFVRSEYSTGQFTGGQLDHPLANLCVPGANVDCEWAEDLDTRRATFVVTKCGVDGLGSPDYREILDTSIKEGVRVVYFAGFQLTTCLKETAISTHKVLKSLGSRSVVLAWLAGARRSSYLPDRSEGSRVVGVEGELIAAGVEILRSPLTGSDLAV
jgi:nicotinamidase-related amidase